LAPPARSRRRARTRARPALSAPARRLSGEADRTRWASRSGLPGARSTPGRPARKLGGRPARLAERAADELARLPREPKHRFLCLAGAPSDGAVDHPQPLDGSAGAVAHPHTLAGGELRHPARFAGQKPRRIDRQRGVGGIADVGLDDGLVEASCSGAKAPLAGGLRDQRPGDLGDDVGPELPGQLPDRRLVRDALRERDQAEATQMEGVRDLPAQGLIAQPERCLTTISRRLTAIGISVAD
jgi:hypothetical protein